jgi:hypothetical protein
MKTCPDCSETSTRRNRKALTTGAKSIFLLLLLLLLLLLGGCAATTPREQQDLLALSDEVREIFESNTVLPDHVYYYSGPEAEPEAIIGIHTSFTLQARYWHQVALTKEQLQSWNRRIDNTHRIRFAYEGARIMTPDGRQVGVWYSKFENTEICFPDEKTIIIYTPDPPPVRGLIRHCFPYLQF